MDKYRRKCRVDAAYLRASIALSLLALLFPTLAFPQGIAVRAPAAAVPGNLAVFGGSPNLILDGGAVPAGTANAILNIPVGGFGTNTSFFPSNGIAAVTFGGNVLGLGTNENLGELWLSDLGFSPTNSAAGNSNALNQGILIVSNWGGGILRYGQRGTNRTGVAITIPLNGEHVFPIMAYPSRIRIVGDGDTVINWTGTTTTNAVFVGQFDAFNVLMTGPRTVAAADAYPYTNLCAFEEVGFFDPVLQDCYVSGFGQGIAAVQTGSFRGARFVGVHVSSCDTGIALGDACDQITLVQTDCRNCLWGLDISAVVPNPTNNFPSLTGVTGGTNIGPTRIVNSMGGIWDYNSNACVVMGKGYYVGGFYAGNETRYQFVIGHPTNMITTVPYQNEGNCQIKLERSWWGENPVTTNIWVAPQLANGGGNIEIDAPSAIGGTTGYGIVGLFAHVKWAPGVFGMTTNYLPYPGVANGFNYSEDGVDYQTSPGKRVLTFDEPGGPYANGVVIDNHEFHTSTSSANTLVKWHAVDFSRADRMFLELDQLGSSKYALNASGVSINTDQTNAAGWGRFTNSIFASTNTAPIGFVSNLTITSGTQITNLLNANVELVGELICQAGSTGSPAGIGTADYNPTINGVALQEAGLGAQTIRGVFTNLIQIHFCDRLGPGDYFNFATNLAGSSSSVSFQSFRFKVVP